MANTTKNNLNEFLSRIGYDSSKMHVIYDEMTILVEWEEENTESSYLDMDYYSFTGEWLIHINNTFRTVNEILFDFLHEIGHIRLLNKQDSISGPSEFIDTRGYKVSDRDYIIHEMACDAYAINMLEYRGTVTKYLPLTNIKNVMEKQGCDKDEAKQFVTSVNQDTKVRRNYLEYLISENIPISAKKKPVSKKPLAKMGNLKLPETSKGKRMPRFIATRILRELAESCGIDTADDKHRQKTPIMECLDKIGICYSTYDDFDSLIKILIKRITDPAIKINQWSVPEYKFRRVYEKPDDWGKSYKDYYRGLTNKETKITTYHQYAKIRVEDVVKDDTTGLPEDVVETEDKTGTTKSKENKSKKTYHYELPSFDELNTYQRIELDRICLINQRKSIYSQIVREMIIPYFKKYKEEFRTYKRNEIKYVIENVLHDYITNNIMPTEFSINMLIERYNEIDKTEQTVKTASAGMLTWNERVKKAKEGHPQEKGETDQEYEDRIKKIINAEMEEMNRQKALMKDSYNVPPMPTHPAIINK